MATTTDTGRKYRVGFGDAADGTWMKGGWNVTVHGHKVIQRLVIDGAVKVKEDVPEPEKGTTTFNRDTFLYIPEELYGASTYFSSSGGAEGEQGIDVEHTMFSNQERINNAVMEMVRDSMISLEGTT